MLEGRQRKNSCLPLLRSISADDVQNAKEEQCQGCMTLQQDGGDRNLRLQQQDLDSSGIHEYIKDGPSWEDPYEDIKK